MSETWKQWTGQSVNGEFLLEDYLGGSGHAAVYATRFGAPNAQKAAVKFIAAELQTADQYLSRWKQAALLAHPQLLKIFASGRCRIAGVDLLYVGMEFAEENLSQILPERALTAEEVTQMLPGVAGTLGFLHGRGFAHGQLKPSNIMANGDQLKLSPDSICRVGEALGKRPRPRPWDAPEVPGGRASTAADIWSLGITLVEALTQEIPLLDRKGSADPAVPESLPAPFQAIARSCLRRDPRQRATVADILARLQPPQQPAAAEPLPRQRFAVARQQVAPKRSYTVPVLVGAAVIAAIFGIPWLLSSRPGSEQAAKSATGAPAQAVAAKESSPPPAKLPVAAAEHAQPKFAAAEPKSSPKPPTKAEPKPAPAPKPAPQESAKSISPAPLRVGNEAAPAAPPRAQTVVAASARTGSRGAVLEKVMPEVSQKARDTIHGTVRVSVRVKVDAAGEVSAAELDTPSHSKFFADLAVRAARQWKFQSPVADGRDLPSEWLLNFYFTRTGINVSPAQVTP